MTKKRWIVFCKYASYTLLLVMFYILQTTPRFLQVGSIKPNLLIPVAVLIAIYEGEYVGGIFGAAAGLLCDMGSYTLYGFNGILILVSCVAAGLLTEYLIRQHLPNALMLGGGALLLQGFLEYFFYFHIWGFADSYRVFAFSTLPRIFYSMVCMIPLYFLLGRISCFYAEKLKI